MLRNENQIQNPFTDLPLEKKGSESQKESEIREINQYSK